MRNLDRTAAYVACLPTINRLLNTFEGKLAPSIWAAIAKFPWDATGRDTVI